MREGPPYLIHFPRGGFGTLLGIQRGLFLVKCWRWRKKERQGREAKEGKSGLKQASIGCLKAEGPEMSTDNG